MDKKISVLVLATDYPKMGGKVAHRFVHVRNLYYKKRDIEVTVLNFATEENYIFEGIPVISLQSYKRNQTEYDILLSHQPNIRNHYLFLKKYGKNFPKFMLFFHGHEVLKVNKVYPKPFGYVKRNKAKEKVRDFYDDFKLLVWRFYLPNIVTKTKFVFVSKWMLEEFLKWTKIPFNKIEHNYSITYNCIGDIFEETKYQCFSKKEYDFVTIRSNLDGSKYCIDFVNDLAKKNPQFRFLIVGKGQFFFHNSKAENVIWKNMSMNHTEVIETLQNSRCALMPTRTDAQGLMMCEMASIGMPVITSDIPVCHEVFERFQNVVFIENENVNVDLEKVLKKMEGKEPYKVNSKYYNKNTSENEVNMIHSLLA